MNIYIEVIKFNFLRFLTYPTEILATVFRRIMEIVFLILFWKIVLGKGTGEMRPLISYFLIAQSVSLLIMARRTEFGTYLRKLIKYGNLNYYLTRPMKIIPYVYASTVGNQGLNIGLSIILIIIGIVINPPNNLSNIVAFLLMIPTAAMIAVAFNLIEAIVAFYLTESAPIGASIRRIIEVFSGSIAPLSYFPLEIRNILEKSPFPYMVFGPVNSLTEGGSIKVFVIGLVWAIGLNIVIYWWWRKAIKNYEAVGA